MRKGRKGKKGLDELWRGQGYIVPREAQCEGAQVKTDIEEHHLPDMGWSAPYTDRSRPSCGR